jgi:hypothetical protein
MAAQSSWRTAERSRDVVLVGPALFDQGDHGMSFGHPVAHRVLGNGNAGGKHDAMLPVGA